jgi:hypothetical protein
MASPRVADLNTAGSLLLDPRVSFEPTHGPNCRYRRMCAGVAGSDDGEGQARQFRVDVCGPLQGVSEKGYLFAGDLG